jgi:uncharacterized protein YndB with AHSA1/START domain
MKWILIVLGSLVGLLLLGGVVLFAMGQGADANRITTTVVIHQKPEAVWPWIYKADKVKQWISWLVEIRNEGGKDGEPVVGGKSVWIMEDKNNNNARMEITGTIKAFEPARRIEVDMVANEGFKGHVVYTLTPLPDGSTRLDEDSRYDFDDGFARFMTPVICWQAKKKMIDDQAHLRALVEAGK